MFANGFMGALWLGASVALCIACGVCVWFELMRWLVHVRAADGSFDGESGSPPSHEWTEPKGEQFLSIHIPVYDEPPALVLDTVRALLPYASERIEVILLDNNTKDRARWEPVAQAMMEMPKNFRFIHCAGIKGYKAGALDISRHLCDQRATIIGVFDADYTLIPGDEHLFARILSWFATHQQSGLLQFPQSYRNVERSNRGLLREYGHYFDAFMGLSQARRVAHGTGTAMFVRCKALESIGGWPKRTLTEDAELGLALLSKGWQTQYVARPIAQGLMPARREDFVKQRKRWIQGNVHVLRDALRPSLDVTFRQRVALVLALSSWTNLYVLPLFALIALTALAAFAAPSSSAHHAMLPSLWCLAGGVLGVSMTLRLSSFVRLYGVRDGVEAGLIHWATMPLGAWTLCTSWIAPEKTFVRTNKVICARGGGVHVLAALTPTIIALALMASFSVYVSLFWSPAMLAYVVGSVMLDAQLEQTMRCTRAHT